MSSFNVEYAKNTTLNEVFKAERLQEEVIYVGNEICKAKLLDGKWVIGYVVTTLKVEKNKRKHCYYVKVYDSFLAEKVRVTFYEVDKKTINEKTEFCDKDGRELFQNDIVKNENGVYGIITSLKYTNTIFINFENGKMKMCMAGSADEKALSSIELVGSSYDNKKIAMEILEKHKEKRMKINDVLMKKWHYDNNKK